MLVLEREINQRIYLSDGVSIMVVGFRGGTVRLGIEAPPKILVAREELLGSGNSWDCFRRAAPAEPRALSPAHVEITAQDAPLRLAAARKGRGPRDPRAPGPAGQADEAVRRL